MRIMPIDKNFQIFNKNTLYKNENNITFNNQLNEIKNHNYKTYPFNNAYFISFKGYYEDKNALIQMENMLNKTLENVILSKQFGNQKFENLMKLAQDKNPKLYAKLLQNEKNFSLIEKNFLNYDETTIKSIKKVRYSNLIFDEFWMNNSKTGDKSTFELITTFTKSNDINETLKNMPDEKFKLLTEHLYLNWLFNELNHPHSQYIEEILIENKKLIDEYEKKSNNSNTKRFIKNIEAKHYDILEKNILFNIYDKSINTETKLKSFNKMLNYLSKILLIESPTELEKDLNDIIKLQNKLKKAQFKESFDFINEEIKMLNKIIIKYWEKNELPILMNKDLKKNNYIKNAEQKNKKIKNFQNYNSLNTEQKFFISSYYNFRFNKFDNNDLLKIMIDDRNIENPANCIDMILYKISDIKTSYFEQLDEFKNFIDNDEDISELPERITYNPQNHFSLLNLYLYELNKYELFKDKNSQEKIDYLKSLTEEEINLVTEKIKELWDKQELRYVMDMEVRHQANLTSINKKMYDELLKININLNEIKIKINDVVITLKELIENKHSILNTEDFSKTPINATKQLADIERQYLAMTKEEKTKFDSIMNKAIPPIIDNMLSNTNNKNEQILLTQLKAKCTNTNNTKSSLGFIKMILLSKIMSNPSLKLSALEGILPLSTATSAASSAASTSIISSSFLPAFDPVTATIAAAIVSISIAAIGVAKAKGLEKNQSDIIVTLGE